MRIIAGTFKGFRLAALPGRGIRPTQDRIRESLFNILEGHGPFLKVADLFAGSGALGLEAVSRWPAEAVFVDASGTAVELIRKNIRTLGLESRTRVIQRDVTRGVGFLTRRGGPFDLVFMDPPYSQGLVGRLVPAILERELVLTRGLLVVEHEGGESPPETFRSWNLSDRRSYGRTRISFFQSRER
jgi:16S rRNA (guanine(966)-N(2))-methyltransferase RsmD